MTTEKPFGTVLEFFAHQSTLTDDEWAARDQQIADEKEKSAYVPSVSRSRMNSLADRGWPVRALDAAEKPDATRPAIARLSAWNVDERNVAVLSGPPGTGKTVGAAHWCLARSEHVEFVRASTFAASSRYNAETRERWYGASALCLDDLGAEYLDSKGSFLVDLDELVDTFYADKRPLIITTNLDSAAFKKRYGGRVEDRIRECAVWLVVAGESMRRAP